MSIYPLMLYRDGDQFVWDGRPTDTLIVNDADEHEAATGWLAATEYVASSQAEKTLLDGNAKQIAAELPNLTLAELEALKADEIAGKSRKGVLALLDAAIDENLV